MKIKIVSDEPRAILKYDNLHENETGLLERAKSALRIKGGGRSDAKFFKDDKTGMICVDMNDAGGVGARGVEARSYLEYLMEYTGGDPGKMIYFSHTFDRIMCFDKDAFDEFLDDSENVRNYVNGQIKVLEEVEKSADW